MTIILATRITSITSTNGFEPRPFAAKEGSEGQKITRKGDKGVIEEGTESLCFVILCLLSGSGLRGRGRGCQVKGREVRG